MNNNLYLYDRKRKQPSVLGRMSLTLFLFWVIISFFVGLHYYFAFSRFISIPVVNEDLVISINKWDTFYSLANKLPDIDPFFLKIYLKLTPPDFTLQAWKFLIRTESNIQDTISQLSTPITVDKTITILEWWNIYDIDDYIAWIGLSEPWEFVMVASDVPYKMLQKYSFLKWAISLEGFLYPDTYKVDPGKFTVNKFIDRLINNFQEKINWPLLKNMTSKEIIETINIASLVEKEERNSTQKPIVADIIKKRYNENWNMWIDASVCYHYKLKHSKCTPNFIALNIMDKNEYNTRTKQWLPLTPIWNPSFETVFATINSTKTKYYYYLHDGDWMVHYSETNEEHAAKKRKYLH